MTSPLSAQENTAAVEQSYTVLENDLRAGIGLSEARVQRLMKEIFANMERAENGMRRLMRTRGLEHIIDLLGKPRSMGQVLAFGNLRGEVAFWRRHTVVTYLAELPDALRELKQLNDRLEDVLRARTNVRTPVPARGPERPTRVRSHDRVRSRGR